ncbi:MAG: ABC transporter permease [Bacteroidetes bacterium]|nr:ABC transporter permease [Bacteroidota bacterium]MBS1685263.1 ABC transporter permease [Bacteroidota bacterium]
MAKEKNKEEKAETLNAIVIRQFKKNKPALWSFRLLILIFLIGLSADFIANEKPYYCELNGHTYFPVFRGVGVDWGLTNWPPELSNVNWRDLNYQKVVWPLVPYSPTTLDIKNKDYVSPSAQQDVPSPRWKHYLGTDNLGRDVLSGMIHGTTVAMMVGVVSMSVALLLGLFFGSLAGYYGDNRLKMTRLTIILNVVLLPFAIFYAFSARSYTLSDALALSVWKFLFHFVLSLLIFSSIMAIPNLLDRFLKKIPYLGAQVSVPVDILVSRLIEILESIPSLLLLLSIVAIMDKPSLMMVMVIIGLTRWTGIARYLRGELLRVRSLEYVEAAQALGYPEWRIIIRHTLPNSLTSVLISVSFGIASAILTESSLSFLGIGVPPEQVTWGSMLSLARGVPQAWWIAIFPGFNIFITVTIFNLIGDGLTEALDPRLKQ